MRDKRSIKNITKKHFPVDFFARSKSVDTFQNTKRGRDILKAQKSL